MSESITNEQILQAITELSNQNQELKQELKNESQETRKQIKLLDTKITVLSKSITDAQAEIEMLKEA